MREGGNPVSRRTGLPPPPTPSVRPNHSYIKNLIMNEEYVKNIRNMFTRRKEVSFG